MGVAEQRLIEELMHNAQIAGKPLERRLAELTLWFWHNKQDLAPDNLASRQRFLEKAMWILLEVVALQAERLHELEGKSRNLFLPRGIDIHGDVRKFG